MSDTGGVLIIIFMIWLGITIVIYKLEKIESLLRSRKP